MTDAQRQKLARENVRFIAHAVSMIVFGGSILLLRRLLPQYLDDQKTGIIGDGVALYVPIAMVVGGTLWLAGIAVCARILARKSVDGGLQD